MSGSNDKAARGKKAREAAPPAAAPGNGGARKGFQRLNFFLGQHLDVSDFEAGERYQAEKRRLHNRLLHSQGVVPGHAGELRVKPRRRGEMSIEVAAGMAIDAEGNELILWEPEFRPLDPEKFKLPGTVYVVLRYTDEPVDFVVNKANPRFKGHRRIRESVQLDVSAAPSGPEGGVELARIALDESVREIREAQDPANPGPGEIDLRFVEQAGVAGSSLGAEGLMKLEDLLRLKRRLHTLLWTHHGIHSARDARQAVITAELLVACRLLGQQELVRTFGLINGLETEVIAELREERPEVVRREEFGDYEGEVAALRALTEAPRVDAEEFATALRTLAESTTYLLRFFEEGPGVAPPRRRRKEDHQEQPQEAPAEPSRAFEELERSSGLPESFVAEGVCYKLVDVIDVMNRKSEAEHGFTLKETEDEWNTRSEFFYPDGNKVVDAGRAHKGGYGEWTMKNLQVGKPLCLFKRIDYYYGETSTEVLVDGRSAGVWEVRGSDRKHRWRNVSFRIPGELVQGEAATVRHVADKAGRDVNLYHLWFYQAE